MSPFRSQRCSDGGAVWYRLAAAPASLTIAGRTQYVVSLADLNTVVAMPMPSPTVPVLRPARATRNPPTDRVLGGNAH